MQSTNYPINKVAETDTPEKSSETTSKASSALANNGSTNFSLSTDAVEFVPSNLSSTSKLIEDNLQKQASLD